MSFDKEKWHRSLTMGALTLSVVTLPFSVPLCHLGLIILCINWLTEGQWRTKWKTLKQEPIVFLFVIFFALHLIGLVYSEDKQNGFFNSEKKMTFLFLPMIIATSKIDSNQFNSLLKYFVYAIIAAVFVCLITSSYHTFWEKPIPSNFDLTTTEEFQSLSSKANLAWSYFSYSGLSAAIGMHPTYMGAYILFSIAILIYFYKQENDYAVLINKKVGIALLILLSIFLLLLSSKIIIIGYVLLCLSSAIWVLNNKTAWLSLIGIIAAIVFFIFTNPVTRYRIREVEQFNYSITDNTIYDQSTAIRLSLWWTGWHALKESNLIIGVGTGDTMEVMKNIGEKYGITNILGSHDPHNQFLYTTLSLGVLGLITLLTCLFYPIFQKELIGNFLYLAFLGIVFLICLTESFFELQKGIVFFSIFNSLFIFHFQSSKAQRLNFSHA